jgi:hypothetical protein
VQVDDLERFWRAIAERQPSCRWCLGVRGTCRARMVPGAGGGRSRSNRP